MARTEDTTKRQQYIRSLYCKEEAAFSDVFQTAGEKKGIQLSPEEGKLVSMILAIHKAKYVLEIGTLVGYSCCWIASVLPEDGKVITIEKSKENFEIAKKNFATTKFKDKIITINADGATYLKGLELDYQLDAVFIDAKKVDYPAYLNLSYTLLRKGGLIIADNTLLFGGVYDSQPGEMQEAMKKFNMEISDTEKYRSLIFPTNEGLTVAIKI
ncbi:O-methyltransferase [Candidatus Bandiella euplotis]|uniref:O-methyltransferase n=1 Tax=Candidatus Bandiella euplotis TaxID=1664265 RepID=A0ABZ0UMH5_9RICK|nr:O-methyltransferase [Candidatus Bandiella woodruffii]WPX96134.1 Putative O-methyltransferase [Candidatus Bandiella woodruffii]